MILSIKASFAKSPMSSRWSIFRHASLCEASVSSQITCLGIEAPVPHSLRHYPFTLSADGVIRVRDSLPPDCALVVPSQYGNVSSSHPVVQHNQFAQCRHACIALAGKPHYCAKRSRRALGLGVQLAPPDRRIEKEDARLQRNPVRAHVVYVLHIRGSRGGQVLVFTLNEPVQCFLLALQQARALATRATGQTNRCSGERTGKDPCGAGRPANRSLTCIVRRSPVISHFFFCFLTHCPTFP